MNYEQQMWLYAILCEHGFDEAVQAFKDNIATLGIDGKLEYWVGVEVAKLNDTTVGREEYLDSRIAECERTMREMRNVANDDKLCDRYYVGSVIWNYVLAQSCKAALLELASAQTQPTAAVRQAVNCKPKPTFASIIQSPNKEQVLERLHGLIDGRRGADVGAVLLKARLDGYLARNPTQAEFRSEFQLIGTWQAISKYMSDNNENALDRANKVLIEI